MSYYSSFLSWFYSSPSMAGPARNCPTTNLKDLNPANILVTKEDLENTKLRHVEPFKRKTYFPPKSPVMQELIVIVYQKRQRRLICEAVKRYFR